MDEPLLNINDLKIGFVTPDGILPAVDGVEFSLSRGKTFALLGESGCGKSLTALSMLQLLPQGARIMGQGQIVFNQLDLLSLPEVVMREYRGQKLAMIFQEPMTSLNPVLTIGAQISEVFSCHHQLRKRAAKKRTIELLQAVGIPAPQVCYEHYPHQLSGGMKQRAMIAMALAGNPKILVADEPTTALDVTIQAQVLNLLRDLQRQKGMAILLISHDWGVVAQHSDRVGVMYAGHIVEEANTDELIQAPSHPYTRQLLAALPSLEKRTQRLANINGMVPPLTHHVVGCRFVSRCEWAQALCQEKVPQWQNLSDTHRVRCHAYDQRYRQQFTNKSAELLSDTLKFDSTVNLKSHTAALLQTQNLQVYFPVQKGLMKRTVGYVKAVDDVSLKLMPGKTLALVGESGSGKTTLGKALVQLIQSHAGSIQFNGQELIGSRRSKLKTIRAQLQFIFQDPFSSLNPRMLVQDILAEGLIAQGIKRKSADLQAIIDRLLQQVGLSADSKLRYPHEFSGGQRQRIAIARAIALRPQVLICDEPTSALDVSIQAQVLNLLKDLQRELGLAYLFITHNLSVVSYLADTVAVMYLGRIVEEGSVQEILTAPQHPYTQALLAAVPQVDPKQRCPVILLSGELPTPANPPTGCHFHLRCPHAMPICRQTYPTVTQSSPTHNVRCHLLSNSPK